MESSPVILTAFQYRQLEEVITSLIGQYEIEYVICFGCTQDNKAAVSCFVDDVKQCHTHYFLLIITSGVNRIEHEVQDYVNRHFVGLKITTLVHGTETVGEAVEQGSRFFNVVCRNGMQLYSKSGLRLNLDLPSLSPAVILEKAERHYFNRYNRAIGFVEAARECFNKGYYANSVFMLHQAVEQACIAMVRVYLAYRSDIHNLSRLLDLTLCFSADPSGAFPRKTVEDQRLFQLLLKSYSDARYRDEYEVSREDADALCIQVKAFTDLTESLCTNQINRLRTQIMAPIQQESKQFILSN
jgi:HEPN domain-containing protein